MSASFWRAASGITGRMPGVPRPGISSTSARYLKMLPARGSGGASDLGIWPSWLRIISDHDQPPRPIISARPINVCLTSSRVEVISSSRICAALPMVTASSSAVTGRVRPSALASPLGEGRQKRAGRAKANNSMTSNACAISKPKRL